MKGLQKTEKQKICTMGPVCILKDLFSQRKILSFYSLTKSRALLDLQIIWKGTKMNVTVKNKQLDGCVAANLAVESVSFVKPQGSVFLQSRCFISHTTAQKVRQAREVKDALFSIMAVH